MNIVREIISLEDKEEIKRQDGSKYFDYLAMLFLGFVWTLIILAI